MPKRYLIKGHSIYSLSQNHRKNLKKTMGKYVLLIRLI